MGFTVGFVSTVAFVITFWIIDPISPVDQAPGIPVAMSVWVVPFVVGPITAAIATRTLARRCWSMNGGLAEKKGPRKGGRN